ncbi:maleylpyruvate isomerase family mycothiol-dependent enzyme [Phytomonospora sp. NPDC050363]|uniref:maleylpyruvate isomerase family mycothiol-dependent enzyme n=1 Tax=Phytomonospora sp. NPDC050363 TaxID=3155642 RepID=UPI0033CD6992
MTQAITRTEPDFMEFTRTERTELADLLATLTPPRWDEPSLCAGWSVRDVVAHMLSRDELDPESMIRRFARGRFTLDGANAAGVEEYSGYSPPLLLELFRERIEPQGLAAAFGGRIAFVETFIHHQDIRRGLGEPREIPTERVRAALKLGTAMGPLGATRNMRGLRFDATDVRMVTGTGPEVAGPGEAILMAISGRAQALEDLSGPGVGVLASRLR